MRYSLKCSVLILAAVIGAAFLRLPRLEQRPMHADEAVHAIKFGKLLEDNSYRYDPYEYHGPTLNYITLIPAWLGSAQNLTQVSEFSLRIVPAICGILLVLMILLLTDGLGCKGAIWAAIFTAVSPAFVFYSRYYIQEMLLICFTFGAIAFGWRYTQSKKIWLALLTGFFIGLSHATKETSIIAFGSALLADLITYLMQSQRNNFLSDLKKSIKPIHLISLIATAAIVSALFHSSFFSNPTGIIDSFRTYTTYFIRASQSQLHIYPWYYYLKMLLYSRLTVGPIWTEALILILAVIGFAVAMTKKGITNVNFNLLRFIAFYSVIMTIVYSGIPYKTPWCLLGFLHGMILLAGAGAIAVINLAPKTLPRLFVTLLLIGASIHLAWQGYQTAYKYYADPVNPYVYAHTTNDIFDIARRVEEIAQVHPEKHDMYIQVICTEDDYWPLPWYLRFFSRVSYQSEVIDNMPIAPVIIASPSLEPALLKKLYELRPPGQRNLYVPLFDTNMQLRPQVWLQGYIAKDLWDRLPR